MLTPKYAGFGLSPDIIVSSFSGAVSGDFATNGFTGYQVINNEIALAESEILEMIPDFSRSLNEIKGVAVTVDTSGYVTFPSFVQPLSSGEIKYYQKDKYIEGCEGDYLSPQLSTMRGTSFCQDTLCCPWNGVSELSGQPLPVDSTKEFYSSYISDPNTFNIPSLANMIRNRVCCVLGNNLFATQGDSWKLVDRFCQLADKKLDSHYFPPEMKSVKWVKNPWLSGGFQTIKILRS